MERIKYLLVAAVLFGAFQLNAQTAKQGNWCGFDKWMNDYLDAHPGERDRLHQHKVDIAKKSNGKYTGTKASIIVPTVVHIMHYNGSGNISKAQILDGLRVLNRDFQMQNADTVNIRPDFKPHLGNADIEFRLATKDPNGNCTEGITRNETPLSFDADDAVKAVNRWPHQDYFNIWIVNTIESSGPGIILGYAQFPGFGPWNEYGFVCINSAWGTIGTSSSDGRTAVHEVGHCFGLLHTFQGGCAGNCGSSGDYICDTPPVSQATYSCVQTQNSCSNDFQGPDPWGGKNVVDQIENYMSYDGCQYMFSKDQVSQMISTINGSGTLTGLTSNSNLIQTGTQNGAPAPNCAPIAVFSWDKETICAGNTIQFTDQSYNGQPTSWSWSFPGGTPSSSTDSMPTVTYNTPGTYNVTMTATNAAGNDSHTETSLVTVESTTAQYGGFSYSEGFENTTVFNNDWTVENPSGSRKWEIKNGTAFTGVQSMYILNHSNNSGDIDYAISPSLDLSSYQGGAQMTFQWAYRQKQTSDLDELRLEYSLDCGATWSLKWIRKGVSLATAAANSGFFNPTSPPTDWSLATVDLNNIASQTNVKFRFKFTADGGGNIYVDDINIAGLTGVGEKLPVNGDVKIFPNPSTDVTNIQFDLYDNADNAKIEIFDMVGKVVARPLAGQKLMQGSHNLTIDNAATLPSGVYLVNIQIDDYKKVERLVVN